MQATVRAMSKREGEQVCVNLYTHILGVFPQIGHSSICFDKMHTFFVVRGIHIYRYTRIRPLMTDATRGHGELGLHARPWAEDPIEPEEERNNKYTRRYMIKTINQ